MVHNCYLCNVNFSSKRNLDNHLQKQVCLKKNEKNKCDLCHKTFSSKQRLDYHINQVNCTTKNTVQIENTINSLEIEKLKIELQIEGEKTKQIEEKTKQKQIELKIMREKKLVKIKCKTSNSYNNSNNTINIDTVNIHPVAFGKEDLSILNDENVIKYILNRPAKAIEDIVKTIYCNKSIKLNHTVYIPSRNKSIAMVSNGQRFIHKDAVETVELLYSDGKDKLDDLLESKKNELTKFQIKMYNENEENPKNEEKIKRNIKLGLIDMEAVIKSELQNIKNID